MNDETTTTTINEQNVQSWLELLADGELPADSAAKLFDFLEGHPQYWRDCAVKLWDAQTLEHWFKPDGAGHHITASRPAASIDVGLHSQSSDSPTHPDNLPEQPVAWLRTVAQPLKQIPERSTAVRGNRWMALALVLALILGFGGWVRSESIRLQQSLRHKTNIQEWQNGFQFMSAQLLAERSSFRSLASFFPDHPQLIEIENNPVRAVFLTDRPLSNELMQWLVSEGSRVDVRPYRPQVKSLLWESYEQPVLEIEVTKLGMLAPN